MGRQEQHLEAFGGLAGLSAQGLAGEALCRGLLDILSLGLSCATPKLSLSTDVPLKSTPVPLPTPEHYMQEINSIFLYISTSVFTGVFNSWNHYALPDFAFC